jgi:hypothetical protein
MKLNTLMLKSKVLEAIKEFNEFRSPEATAELISINNDKIIIKMSGTYCRSCGLYDYFEDLSWKFKDYLNADVKILSTRMLDPFSYEIVYKLEAQG